MSIDARTEQALQHAWQALAQAELEALGDHLTYHSVRSILVTLVNAVRSEAPHPDTPEVARIPAIERTPVISNWIAAIGYNLASRRMVIDTTDGRSFFYADVPYEVYSEIMQAPSHGQAFNRLVRRRYPSGPVIEVTEGECASCKAKGLSGCTCECGGVFAGV